jgi:pimeloyl-ACP methyl ester carboxylesterase
VIFGGSKTLKIKRRVKRFMTKKWSLSVFTILMVGLLMAGVALATTVSDDQPDSSAYVGYNWNAYLPAFKDVNGVSIPFRPVGILPPIGYQGDFYVNEFTDSKIKQTWQELKEKDPDAAKKILAGVCANTDETAQNRYRRIGCFDPKGAVNGNNDFKLTEIRRPAFFGQAPYFEDIAKVEQDTYTVEFTVPRGYYERVQLKLTTPLKLRGWFIKGKGVPGVKGKRIHALIIYTPGSSCQICAIQHPDAPGYKYNIQTKRYEGIPYPNKNYQTESWGMLQHRQYLYGFNQAGFDVLMVDKRGHGYSGGVNANDNSENAEDLFRILEQLETGNGLTILTPTGQLLQGKETAGLLLRGMTARQVPVLIGGQSQGTQITCFAMQKNFVGWTAYNEPGHKFSPAKRYNIKGAFLFADFSGGLGYYGKPDLEVVYQEAARRVEWNTMWAPTSEILANIDKWPAVFFGQGLWDTFESPEGTYEAYHRAKGLKKLVFIRGGHSLSMWGTENVANLINNMTEFAVRAVVNPGQKYPELKSFKEAVLSSPPYWEPTSRP